MFNLAFAISVIINYHADLVAIWATSTRYTFSN